MTDPEYETRVWLAENLARMGHGSKGRLAAFLRVRPDAITRMANTDPEKEVREIRAHELLKMRAFFAGDDETPEHLLGRSIPIMGFLGAGAEVEPDYEQVPPEGLETIDLPFGVTEDLIGFRVKGTSMLPFYKEGAVIVVYREQKKPLESFYGEEAAVRTTDGRRFIKTIMRGQGNTVNLISWNAAPIENVHLEWIGEIFATLPASALRTINRRGVQGQLKLRA